MTEKELKRLSRSELLELLLLQTREVERLNKKLEKTEKMLCNRYLKIKKAGDLAHAVLEINGVIDGAQAAAQQYLDNIAQMEKDTAVRCERILIAAKREAVRILKEARGAAESGKTHIGAAQMPGGAKNSSEVTKPRIIEVNALPKNKD